MPGKLTEQPAAGVGTEDDLYLVVQAAQSRKQTRAQLRTGILSAWQSFIRTFLGAATTADARTAIGAIGSTDNITGSAAKLTTSRTISATGDGTWSVVFDGSANASGALTLANSGVGAGTYGTVTVNAKGLVTEGTGVGAGVATFLATPSSANLRAALTDETGTGGAVFATTPTISQPNIVGVTAASNAAAGSVGEYVSSTLAAGSATALTSATAKTVTSISLTAGDWDVWGVVGLAPAGSTTTTVQVGAISTVNNTLPTVPGEGAYYATSAQSPAGQGNIFPVGMTRVSIAATTTVYLIAQSTFAVSTSAAYGFIGARRVR